VRTGQQAAEFRKGLTNRAEEALSRAKNRERSPLWSDLQIGVYTTEFTLKVHRKGVMQKNASFLAGELGPNSRKFTRDDSKGVAD
jgi:hypothetical protein